MAPNLEHEDSIEHAGASLIEDAEFAADANHIAKHIVADVGRRIADGMLDDSPDYVSKLAISQSIEDADKAVQGAKVVKDVAGAAGAVAKIMEAHESKKMSDIVDAAASTVGVLRVPLVGSIGSVAKDVLSANETSNDHDILQNRMKAGSKVLSAIPGYMLGGPEGADLAVSGTDIAIDSGIAGAMKAAEIYGEWTTSTPNLKPVAPNPEKHHASSSGIDSADFMEARHFVSPTDSFDDGREGNLGDRSSPILDGQNTLLLRNDPAWDQTNSVAAESSTTTSTSTDEASSDEASAESEVNLTNGTSPTDREETDSDTYISDLSTASAASDLAQSADDEDSYASETNLLQQGSILSADETPDPEVSYASSEEATTTEITETEITEPSDNNDESYMAEAQPDSEGPTDSVMPTLDVESDALDEEANSFDAGAYSGRFGPTAMEIDDGNLASYTEGASFDEYSTGRYAQAEVEDSTEMEEREDIESDVEESSQPDIVTSEPESSYSNSDELSSDAPEADE